MNADTRVAAVAGEAGLNPAISEHVIMPCLTMLLHTAAASPSSAAPVASAAVVGAAGDLTAGRTTGTTLPGAGSGPSAGTTGGTTPPGGTSAGGQRAAASHREASQSAGKIAGRMICNRMRTVKESVCGGLS